MRPLQLLAVVVIPILVAHSPARARTRDEISKQVVAELRAIDPEAAELFGRADAASDAGDFASASRLYGEVIARVPASADAHRRRAHAERYLGHAADAEALARKAVELRRDEFNLAALAEIVSAAAPEGAAGASARDEAVGLAKEAAALNPSEAQPHVVLAQIALSRKDLVAARAEVDEALALDSSEFWSHFLSAIVAGESGDLTRSRADLERARELGLPDEPYRGLSEALDDATPWHRRLLGIAVPVVGGWAGAFALLLVGGLVLSSRAMAFAERPARQAERHAMPGGLRRAYTTLLWLACAFYYVSLPLVLLVVATLGAAMILGLLQLSHVPVKLVIIPVVIVLVTTWAILRSLFLRLRDEDPGERVDLDAHPRLKAELEDVARRIGTAPVDDVFLTPGTEVAVFERGGLMRQARGTTRRCLILGAGVLHDMPLNALRAVLGHEMGHLCNRDTAGGRVAIFVRNHLNQTARRLAEGGAATWYNPAWWFLNAYLRMFLRISHGASRLQEVMADRWAVSAYGSSSFIEGLKHVIRREIALSGQARAALEAWSLTNVPGDNLYAFSGAGVPAGADVEEKLAQFLEKPGSPYDSHPRPADRFRLAAAMDVPVPPGDEDVAAWTLFEDRAAIEKRMTALVVSFNT